LHSFANAARAMDERRCGGRNPQEHHCRSAAMGYPSRRRTWGVAILAGVLAAPPALAAGGGGGGTASGMKVGTDVHDLPDYQGGVQAINEQRWGDAITLFARHVRRNWRDADAHNWLGYSYRKAGRLDEAFRAYGNALSIDPRHQGAHEYIGEAYLQAGRPAEADKHLQRLAALCGTQCEPYVELKEAMERYRSTQSSATPANTAAPSQ
jgi:tetratricopeptide (TPR) repeat protein